jgi:hypothetical protein
MVRPRRHHSAGTGARSGPSLGPDWLAREEIKKRWAREADEVREQGEADLGITAARQMWDRRVQEINDVRTAAERKAGEDCQAARGHAELEREQLGARPTLSDYER